MDKLHIYDISGFSDEQIISVLRQIVLSHPGCGAVRIIKAKANQALYCAIFRLTNFLDTPETGFINLQTRIYVICAGITSIVGLPHCENCGKLIKRNVISVHAGFPHKTCSLSCAAFNPNRKAKIAQTNLGRHGTAIWNNGTQISSSLKNMDPERRKLATERFLKTRNRHIAENPDFWKERLEKTQQTKLRRHGDPNWQNGKKISETKRLKAQRDPAYYKAASDKAKDTRLVKYGDASFNNPGKAKKTKLERYGDPTFTNREKAAQTFLEKYGVDNCAKADSVKAKAKATCLERYGVDCYAKTADFREESQRTCLERYGAPYFTQSEAGRKMLSVRNNTAYYTEKICSPESEVEPLFSLEEYCSRSSEAELRWRCRKCGGEFAGPATVAWAANGGQVARCPVCHPADTGKSEKQRQVFDFLQSLPGPGFTADDRKAIFPLEIDALRNDWKAGLEFDGIYWHSSWGGFSAGHLLEKTRLCTKRGIELVHLFEDEWDLRRPQCEAELRRIFAWREQKLGKIHVEAVSKEEAQAFLDANSHDLFAKASRFNAIAYCGKKPVACASFSVFSGKAKISELCLAIDVDLIKPLAVLVKHVEAAAYRLNAYAVSVHMDNRWPIHRRLAALGFKPMKRTAAAMWLIDVNQGWKRKSRGADAKALSAYGTYCDRQKQEFMFKHNLAYIIDCGYTIYDK